MHSGIAGLAPALAEIRLARGWTDEEQALADGIVDRIRHRTAAETDVSYFLGLTSGIGAPGCAGCRDHGLAGPDPRARHPRRLVTGHLRAAEESGWGAGQRRRHRCGRGRARGDLGWRTPRQRGGRAGRRRPPAQGRTASDRSQLADDLARGPDRESYGPAQLLAWDGRGCHRPGPGRRGPRSRRPRRGREARRGAPGHAGRHQGRRFRRTPLPAAWRLRRGRGDLYLVPRPHRYVVAVPRARPGRSPRRRRRPAPRVARAVSAQRAEPPGCRSGCTRVSGTTTVAAAVRRGWATCSSTATSAQATRPTCSSPY